MRGAKKKQTKIDPAELEKARAEAKTKFAEAVIAVQGNDSAKDWITRHNAIVADLFGENAELFKKFLGATSQANSVKGNVTLALRAYEEALSGKIVPGTYLWPVYGNLIRSLKGLIPQGPKIGEYTRALLGDPDRVPVDRHVASFFFGVKDPTLEHTLAAQELLREVAAHLKISPIEAQSSLWNFVQKLKGLAEDDYAQVLAPYRERIQQIHEQYGTELPARKQGSAGADGGNRNATGGTVSATERGGRFAPGGRTGEGGAGESPFRRAGRSQDAGREVEGPPPSLFKRSARDVAGDVIKGAPAFAVDALNAPRSLQSSADISAAGRQGIILTVAHPGLAAKAFKEQIRNFREVNYDNWSQEMDSRPNAPLYEDVNLKLGYAGHGEEAFLSKLVQRLPWVKGSEQAYITYLDQLRADVFDKYARMLGVNEGAAPNDAQLKSLKNIAAFINDASGKGELGSLEGSKKLLSAAFYSPSFAASRVALLNPARYVKLWRDDPAAAKIVTQSMGKFVAASAGALVLARSLGFQVETDWQSPDFLKIKTKDGKFTYDISGGLTQYLRLAFRLVDATYQRATGERPDRDNDAPAILGQFAKGKLSPSASLPFEFYSGKDGGGNPVTPASAVLSRVLPLPVSGMYEAFSQEGLMSGSRSLPDVIGIGTKYRPNGNNGRFRSAGGDSSMPKLAALPDLPALPKM